MNPWFDDFDDAFGTGEEGQDMSKWTDAFALAYGDPEDWTQLSALMTVRAGKPVTEEWLQANIDEAFSHIVYYAPCREGEWLDAADLPATVATVLVSLLARASSNPEGVRTIQMGEFSQTWAGSIHGDGGPVTQKEIQMISRAAGCQDSGLQVVTVSPTPILGDDPALSGS